MKYIELFAGIGGFALALDKLGHECVYTNEWDKHAVKVYEKQFNRTVDTRDIRKVSTEEIPEHDLLVGGFPCQAFSIAGKRRGFDDTRGTLFFEIARILKDKQPKYFILENVKGLLSHDNGNTFRTIITTLTELGYDLQWSVCNSKNYGVAQNRERVFIVGHIRGTSRPEVFSFRKTNTVHSKEGKTGVCTNTLTVGNAGKYSTTGATCINVVGMLSGDVWSKTHEHVRRIYGTDGIAPTVTTGKKVWIPENTLLRRLTEVECERLQGFPDGFSEGISSTQRYKCLGNAVTVNVVYEIAKNL
jgi:DNA (cytosine-5)-methyltransferase 1